MESTVNVSLPQYYDSHFPMFWMNMTDDEKNKWKAVANYLRNAGIPRFELTNLIDAVSIVNHVVSGLFV